MSLSCWRGIVGDGIEPLVIYIDRELERQRRVWAICALTPPGYTPDRRPSVPEDQQTLGLRLSKDGVRLAARRQTTRTREVDKTENNHRTFHGAQNASKSAINTRGMPLIEYVSTCLSGIEHIG